MEDLHPPGSGEYTQYGTMSKTAEKLEPCGFARCNACYLVNLHCVEAVRGYTVTVAGEPLKISQPCKKAFMQQWEAYREKG